MTSKYQMTGIQFATAMECSEFLLSQGFQLSSEGFSKIDECDGELIEVSYTLTKRKCFLTIKKR